MIVCLRVNLTRLMSNYVPGISTLTATPTLRPRLGRVGPDSEMVQSWDGQEGARMAKHEQALARPHATKALTH